MPPAVQVGLTEEIPPIVYVDWGTRLDMNEGAVRVALHRLRRRFGEALRAQVAQTVSTPEEVEEEIRNLFASVAAGQMAKQETCKTQAGLL